MRTPILLAVSAVIAIPVLLAPPALASAADPRVGECFDITMEQASADVWPGSSVVPCTSPHTVEVVKTSPLPADVDAVDFSRANCGYADLMNVIGVNAPVKGVIANPIRMGTFAFVVSEEGSPATYACAVGVLRYNGTEDASFVPMTSAAADLTAAERASFRVCVAAPKDRQPGDNPLSVPCTRKPRWQAIAWVDLSQFFTGFPGEAAAQAKVKALCPRGTGWTVPSAAAWKSGYTRGWCWKKYA